MNEIPKNCPICNKRLKLTAIKCKCNNYYCNIHRYPDMHDCSYNYIISQQITIEKNNPKIQPTKIINF